MAEKDYLCIADWDYGEMDGRAVTGGRLTTEATEGVVTIRSNRLSQEVLRGISAAPLLPDERPE